MLTRKKLMSKDPQNWNSIPIQFYNTINLAADDSHRLLSRFQELDITLPSSTLKS